jgi:hypothetical protein
MDKIKRTCGTPNLITWTLKNARKRALYGKTFRDTFCQDSRIEAN